MNDRFKNAIACFILTIAVIALVFAGREEFSGTQTGIHAGSIAWFVVALLSLLLALVVGNGQLLKQLNLRFGKEKGVDLVFFKSVTTIPAATPAKVLTPEVQIEREAVAEQIRAVHPLPGDNAPRFSPILPSNVDELLVRPSAYPMTSMYLLDNNFRILDWNEAFTLAFDRTMEGRKGHGVLEWTFFLDNYTEVLAHGDKAFGDPKNLPAVDVEQIQFTSGRYGKLSATKRAYKIPDDRADGGGDPCLAWLVTLDVKFADENQGMRYKQDLIRLLSMDLMWSEYAVIYDRILNNTSVYPELLDRLVGGPTGPAAIPQHARVLDLGAGTGNLTLKLITTGQERLVLAAENNRVMLDMLRCKCRPHLQTNGKGSGVKAFKQDITSLYGLDDNDFDYVMLNNVLYAVEDEMSCLRDICSVLKPGGELRLSGPRKDSQIEVLFDRIKTDLISKGKFEELKDEYNHVWNINKTRLDPWLYRWTRNELEQKVLEAGFSEIVYSTDDVYAGQSMLICARK